MTLLSKPSSEKAKLRFASLVQGYMMLRLDYARNTIDTKGRKVRNCFLSDLKKFRIGFDPDAAIPYRYRRRDGCPRAHKRIEHNPFAQRKCRPHYLTHE